MEQPYAILRLGFVSEIYCTREDFFSNVLHDIKKHCEICEEMIDEGTFDDELNSIDIIFGFSS